MRGVYVIASAGNSGAYGVTHPASASKNSWYGDFVIGVGSVDSNDVRSVFSSYGEGVEIVAPGERIYTLGPDASTMHASGTSFAAPLVTGALALGLAEFEGWYGYSLATTLSSTSDKSIYARSANQNYTNLLGEGRLDVEAFMANIDEAGD